jgi:hypothetical protein
VTPNASNLPIKNVQVASLERASTTSLQVSGVNGYTLERNDRRNGRPAYRGDHPCAWRYAADGYVPVRLFGVAPITGMGDETIVNYGDVGTPAVEGLNAGAENRDGSSGISITPARPMARST